ncbi:MAG: ferrochelatase [Anaerolineae bacterium]
MNRARRTEPIGVLMMAYGGPTSLEEVEPYLLDVRGGRPTPPELVEEIRERYRRIGGRSPLLEITRAQARALEGRLTAGGSHRFRVYVGMRHWHPYIEEAVGEMVADGVRQAVALCMAPQYSRMSVGAYFRELEGALGRTLADLEMVSVESWNDHPLLLRAFGDKIEEALHRFPQGTRQKVPVLFTAHSLPARILEEGDLYPGELQETVRGIVDLLGLVEWRFAYQSQAHSDEPWLGPEVETVLTELAEAGHTQVLVAPIGFVADHVEVLYDIDIEARHAAASRGLRLQRIDSLNTLPTFVSAMASVVRHALGGP